MTELSSAADDRIYNNNTSYSTVCSSSSSSSEESNNRSSSNSSSHDHELPHHKKTSKGNCRFGCQCSFKRKEKHSREQTVPITISKHHCKWRRQSVCKHLCVANCYHDKSKMSDKNDNSNALKVHYPEEYRKRKRSKVSSKLSRCVQNTSASCGRCYYKCGKRWLLDDRVDESARVYYNKKRKTSSSSKKSQRHCNFHHLKDTSDEETRKHSKMMHRDGCYKRERATSISCMNTSTGDKSIEATGDCSRIQGIFPIFPVH